VDDLRPSEPARALPRRPVGISVVIPVNGDRRLARCLGGLARQTPDELAFEVVVIDDGASGETRRVAE
jgi:glycosyltransferase involved in cell wall biosynthesis